MLKRIHIKNYKSLVDVEIHLDALTVIFGANAAGKSNFLDALQLLSRLTTSRTLKDAFTHPYRGKPLESFTFGPRGIQGLLEQETATFSIEVDVELSEKVREAVNKQILEMTPTTSAQQNGSSSSNVTLVQEERLRYRIEIEILPRSGILRVSDEYLAALDTNNHPTSQQKPFLEQIENQLVVHMEGQAHPNYYERYLDHTLLSLPLYPPHYPHLVAMRHELASWLLFYFEPRERMRESNNVKEIRHIGLRGEDLAAFLNTLKALDERQFRAIEQSLHMIIPAITGIRVEINSLGEVELYVLEGTTPIPARVLSEGTLRILGLLALGGAKETPALIGFEEPENGIHPRRVRLIADLFHTRAFSHKSQVIVTTHSPLLPDLIPSEFLYICHKRQGKTTIEQVAKYDNVCVSNGYSEGVLEEDTLSLSERILRGDFDD